MFVAVLNVKEFEARNLTVVPVYEVGGIIINQTVHHHHHRPVSCPNELLSHWEEKRLLDDGGDRGGNNMADSQQHLGDMIVNEALYDTPQHDAKKSVGKL